MNVISKKERIEQLIVYIACAVLFIWDIWYVNETRLIIGVIAIPVCFVITYKYPFFASRVALLILTIAMCFYGVNFYSTFEYQFTFESARVWELLDRSRNDIFRLGIVGLAIIVSYWVLRKQTAKESNFTSVSKQISIHRKFVYTFLIALLVLFSSAWIYPRATCQINGGNWVYGGISGQAQYCQIEYADGGMSCSSSNECSGNCIITDWPNNEEIPVAGVCTQNNSPFGCYALIENPEHFKCVD